MPRLLRVSEAAQYLNVKESTIREWLTRGKITRVRVGERCVRIPLDALEKLVDEGTTPAREPVRATETAQGEAA